MARAADAMTSCLIFFITALMASSAWGLDLVKFTESDTNNVYSPCKDTTVQWGDGFTFGIAFSNQKSDFFVKEVQYSPCDSRLSSLSSGRLSIFRPKVDQISLLIINESNIDLSNPKLMVTFAGSKYAAISYPHTVASSAHVITSFTLISKTSEELDMSSVSFLCNDGSTSTESIVRPPRANISDESHWTGDWYIKKGYSTI